MKTIIIISFSNLNTDPRVNRQIRFLNDKYHVIAVGFADPEVANVQFIPVTRRGKSLLGKMVAAWRFLCRRYASHYWHLDLVVSCLERLSDIQPDLVLANDIDSLPLALELAQGPRIIFDAHEYFPRQSEDRLLSRMFFQQYRNYLCQTYIPKVDAMTTVCQGIADQYEKDTGVTSIVLTNAPGYEDIEPNMNTGDVKRIRLIHHGAAIPSRRIENMIEVMGHLDNRFELDMLLVPGSESYIKKLKKLARNNTNIRFLAPVPMRQLVRFSSQYDIGLVLLEPNSFNHLHALPNKFFEFIQARLAVAIGPSPEMAKIVETHDCGVVASDFSPKSLAHCLLQLDHTKINHHKCQSHKIAGMMCAEQNRRILSNLVEHVLGQ